MAAALPQIELVSAGLVKGKYVDLKKKAKGILISTGMIGLPLRIGSTEIHASAAVLCPGV